MISQDVAIGFIFATFCFIGIVREQWFLTNSRYGQSLIFWFGKPGAVLIFRFLMVAGMIFGVFLGLGIIRPMKWRTDTQISFARCNRTP